VSTICFAQSTRKTLVDDSDGDNGLNSTLVEWPAPETVLSDIASTDDKKRLHALVLLGVDQVEQLKEVPVVDDVMLRYIQLDEASDDRQAILTAKISYDYEYVAIAVKTSTGWKRIGAASCWCKYERGDLLANFTHIEYSPTADRELVIHSSAEARDFTSKAKCVTACMMASWFSSLHLLVARCPVP